MDDDQSVHSNFLKSDVKSWFGTNFMASNIRQVIENVQILQPIVDVGNTRSSDSSDDESMHTCGDETPKESADEMEVENEEGLTFGFSFMQALSKLFTLKVVQLAATSSRFVQQHVTDITWHSWQ